MTVVLLVRVQRCSSALPSALQVRTRSDNARDQTHLPFPDREVLTMPDSEDTKEWVEDVDGYEKLTFRVEKLRYRGSRDELSVHIYEGDGPDATHDMYRFWITDEENHECKYHETRGEAEPSDFALYAVRQYGWDCTNFDVPDDEEATESITSTYRNLADSMFQMYATANSEPEGDLLMEAATALELAAELREPMSDGSDQTVGQALANIEDAEDGEIHLSPSVRINASQEFKRTISNSITERMRELYGEYNDLEMEFTDDRVLK